MKKTFILLAMAFFGFMSVSQAQFEQGQKDANIGIGLGATFGTGSVQLPPVSFSLDYGFNDNISIGGYVGYSSFKEEVMSWSWKYTYIIVGVRGAYHLALVDKLDTYAGVMLGYNIASAKFAGSHNGIPEPKVGGIAYSGFVGARYHFGDKFGVFGEVGYGIALLNLGLTLKL